MKAFDAALCMRCEDAEPTLGSFFCDSCRQALEHPVPATPLARLPTPARPPSRITKINARS